jgi:hypothetical protein
MELPSLDALGSLLVFIWPGVLALQTYRAIMPARQLDWTATGQALFYSVLNYIIFFLPARFVLHADNLELHPWLYWLFILVLLLFGPIGLAFLYKYAHRWKPIGRLIQAPYPTSWDFFFGQRREVFVLVHLNSGGLLGGYWGAGSYASSFPEAGDLYIRVACRVDAKGQFEEVVSRTRGILIRREEFSYLEFFDAGSGSVTTEGGEDAQPQLKGGAGA